MKTKLFRAKKSTFVSVDFVKIPDRGDRIAPLLHSGVLDASICARPRFAEPATTADFAVLVAEPSPTSV